MFSTYLLLKGNNKYSLTIWHSESIFLIDGGGGQIVTVTAIKIYSKRKHMLNILSSLKKAADDLFNSPSARARRDVAAFKKTARQMGYKIFYAHLSRAKDENDRHVLLYAAVPRPSVSEESLLRAEEFFLQPEFRSIALKRHCLSFADVAY